MIATLMPAAVRRPAKGGPACPVPMTIASYFFIPALDQMTACIRCIVSSPAGEARVERHSAVDDQRDAVDIIGGIRGEPDARAGDVVGLANAAVGDQLHQLGIGFRRAPRRSVDRRSNGAGADAVDADSMRRE